MNKNWKFYDKNKEIPLPNGEYSNIWNNTFSNLNIIINIKPVLILGKDEMENETYYGFIAFISPESQAPGSKNRLVKIIISHTDKEDKLVSMENIM